ncbi:outer membrane protein assembly complex, YaeT protein [Fodinibius roseus]|uniref:Outer membrane protein assembly complex, YaeT protein n=1 Tax=Fodinibius roseus TaxID=1194090 RepID=A0A1M4V0T0_9BACT|nr:BamA/TamA family outer membrane protein [Fodinibius roseus]SHE62591.1 outer membrane protein assembly complex, YaeT protein [Fodinibius roseus]
MGLLLCSWCYSVEAQQRGGSPSYDDERSPQVWDLDVEGNDSFSDIIIRDQIATEAVTFWDKLKFWRHGGHNLSEITIQKDVVRIRNYYNRRGFPDVQVEYRIEDGNKPWKKHVVFIINEQAPIRIGEINYEFTGDDRHREMVLDSPAFARVRRQSEFRGGERYETIKEPEVVGSYEQLLKNMGFSYAEVAVGSEVDTTRLTADLTIHCSLGPMTYFDTISVAGDSTVSDDYIIRESGLKKGQQYSINALQDAQREIFNHHLFRFATINIPDQPRDSTLNLEMQIRENSLRTVQMLAGFGTDEYLRGQVRWIHRNAFGYGHQFTSTARASFIEQTLNFDYLIPYVYNTKSSVVISPFAQHLLEDNYELYRLGVTNSFIYRYSQNMTGSVSYQFTRNSELSQQLDENLPDTTQNYDLSSIQLSGYYNQSLGRRGQEGWAIQPYIEISGFLGSSTFKFQKFSLDVRRYTPLTTTTTLATRLQAGKLFATQEDSLPNNIRYYLGGTSSIRGWGRYQLGPKRAVTDTLKNDSGEIVSDTTAFSRYIPAGGRTFFAFNLELRQDIDALINGFGLTAFLDGGQVWRKDPDIEDRPLQFSVGGGVRYNSPIGPVRLDVGYKVNPSDADLNRYRGRDFGNAWDRIGIHISVGQAF